ncbi:MAG: CoA transferase [Alphaproteobacteria bacterium]|nr:MAG: CoA transferase [Alphaproteobacteria bacterium]
MSEPIARRALAEIWRAGGQSEAAFEAIDLTGAEPVLPSSFPVGSAAQATIAAAALAAGELWRLRTGRHQRISVDMRSAAIEFRSERYLRVDGKPPREHHDEIAGLYRCGDGRWVRLHTNLPHHRDGALALLGCRHERAAVERALDGWRAEALETAAAEAGLVVTACRTFAEWDELPQGRAVAGLPLFTVDQIGEAPARALPAAERPLAGVKVLDLTRIIAGPVCGRTLAAHGADVLLITASHLPSLEPLVIDTGRGKLSASLDLRQASGREALAALLRDADVFVQGYRPGAIASFGFGPQDVARIRPGIIYVSLCAYGHEGPWAGRRGFDSSEPRPLPAQVLDHATGQLMAFAAMSALARRHARGGSWHVRASLAQTGHWFRRLGRLDGRTCRDPGFAEVGDRLEDAPSGFGQLTAVRHAAVMTETPPHWARQTVPLGTHSPAWP